jgi:hypothetical protein
VRREVLCPVFIEFGVSMKLELNTLSIVAKQKVLLFTVTKMGLNETYSKARIGKYLSDSFPIEDGLKQGDALSPLLFKFASEYDIKKVQEKIKCGTSASGLRG